MKIMTREEREKYEARLFKAQIISAIAAIIIGLVAIFLAAML